MAAAGANANIDSNALLAFFTQMDDQGGVIVRGRTRFERLFLIGRSCVPLCVDALKAAVAEAKAGADVQRYRDAFECIHIAAPNEPEALFDQEWVENTERANKAKTHQLESELKGYKMNLIKESIRMGNEDLGRHFEEIGDLNNAGEAYSRMRPDVSTSKHIIDVGKHLVSVTLQRREWPMVIANLSKITGVQNGEEEKGLQPYTKIVQGIAFMGLEKFEDAAKSFLQIDAGKEGAGKEGAEYKTIASPNDVAVYGGLLALATMDRKDLQTRVLDNQNFRTFLELEPHIRKAISLFVNGRYSACLAILEAYRADYLLDIYLQKHVPALYSQIRSKCIVQYFIPFSCVTLSSLEEAFAVPGKPLVDELVGMIRSGVLQARINTIDKTLVAVSPNPRATLQRLVLDTIDAYERDATERIRRMSIIAADMEVKNARKGNAHAGTQGIDELWLEQANRATAAGGEAS
ncbi:COP9 signalosome complex subunit 1 [Colletotrichum spaethianum]|uniref:COP9 signalosome complex subunit 1 n=1 Tax=Colletotrichum spaethianum TaxID=700344 RepID=A0AA37P993_9PEZI|nr:COP9 signalosome complex subunit 1 [Colletotrichum spaethianum]GKT47991.1 COP9 signalosome complex subunit 1 [Colletotrichum spaethianum]